jgi:ABC-2 type transport system permease protein
MPGESRDITEILSYYLITGGLAGLTMLFRQKFGAYLRKSIKSGEISNFLIKPIALLPSIYATVWGERSVHNITAIISIVIGLVISPPLSFINLILFLIFVLISFSIGFAINLIEGILTLYLESPGGIMNSIAHIARLLSGSLIPLEYFPENIARVIQYLPFAVAIYSPYQSLRYETFNLSVLRELGVGIFWALTLNVLIIYFWRKGLKKYEAVGL